MPTANFSTTSHTGAVFATTRWTLVLSTGVEADRGEALAALCRSAGAFHGPLRVRALPAAAGPVDELLGLARLSIGNELDATGGLAPLSAPVQAELFARLRGANPERFAVHLSDPEWHRQELDRAEAEKNAFAADFHRKALGGSGSDR
jgi:hypothetical protein